MSASLRSSAGKPLKLAHSASANSSWLCDLHVSLSKFQSVGNHLLISFHFSFTKSLFIDLSCYDPHPHSVWLTAKWSCIKHLLWQAHYLCLFVSFLWVLFDMYEFIPWKLTRGLWWSYAPLNRLLSMLLLQQY